MVTFNVFGNCVSRDIFNYFTGGGVKVLQYSGFVNPISMFSDKGEFEMKPEELKEFTGPDFYKRILCQDVNKTSFEYITESMADYIVVDLLGVRFDMLRKNNHYITCASPYIFNQKILERDYKLDTYDKIKFTDITEEEWIESLEKFCKLVLKYYPPGKIIFFEYFGAVDYLDDGIIKKFDTYKENYVKSYNALVCRLNQYALEKFSGCHVLRFPDNVCADKKNIRNLHPLHYNSLYYEYGAKAIETIIKSLCDSEEASILEELRNIYSDRFELLRKRAELKHKASLLTYSSNALNFTKELCLDLLGPNTFIANIKEIKKRKYKIAVLKSEDLAAKLLLKTLEKFNIEVILESPVADIKELMDEDFQKCQRADMVVSANVHSKYTSEKESIKIVLISDLLSKDFLLSSDCYNAKPEIISNDTDLGVFQIGELECLRNELQQQRELLSQQLTDIEKITGEKNKLENENKVLKEEKVKLTSKTMDLTTKIDNLNAEYFLLKSDLVEQINISKEEFQLKQQELENSAQKYLSLQKSTEKIINSLTMEKERLINESKIKMRDLTEKIELVNSQKKDFEIQVKNYSDIIEELNKQVSQYENSRSWKMTKPLRDMVWFFNKNKEDL